MRGQTNIERNMDVLDYNDSLKVEKAIIFLVNSVQQSGHNSKPVILHSIRVGMYLLNHYYPPETVVAGLLHDLLEDTSVTADQLKENFGETIAKIVEANSFDATIRAKIAQHKDTFDRCVKEGKDALLVKAADILDNAPYYGLGNDRSYGIEVINNFLNLARPYLKEEPVFSDLGVSLKKLKAKDE